MIDPAENAGIAMEYLKIYLINQQINKKLSGKPATRKMGELLISDLHSKGETPYPLREQEFSRIK